MTYGELLVCGSLAFLWALSCALIAWRFGHNPILWFFIALVPLLGQLAVIDLLTSAKNNLQNGKVSNIPRRSQLTLRIHAKMSVEEVQNVLARILADNPHATGSIGTESFRLFLPLKSRKQAIRLHGRILATSDGTMIHVWPVPSWLATVLCPLSIIYFCWKVPSPMLFAVGILGIWMFDLISCTLQGYALLEKYFAVNG